MIPYPKIETILKRDEKTFKVIKGEWRTPEFKALVNIEWEFSEKLHGTNIRVSWDGSNVCFNGRTDRAQMHTHLLTELQNKFTAELMESVFEETGCLYGEGIGAKIQKGGRRYGDTPRFVLLDVRVGELWLRQTSVCEIASKCLIDVPAIVGKGDLNDAVNIMESGALRSRYGDFQPEGIIVRPAVDLCDRRGNRIIGKLKYSDFQDHVAE